MSTPQQWGLWSLLIVAVLWLLVTFKASVTDRFTGTCDRGYCKSETSGDCFVCPPGRFSSRGCVHCALCPEGRYNPTQGSSTCLLCAPGMSSSLGSKNCTALAIAAAELAALPTWSATTTMRAGARTLTRCNFTGPWALYNNSCINKRVGEQCWVACSNEFVPKSAVLTCQEDGRFFGTLPTCKKRTCGSSGAAPELGVDDSDCEATREGDSCVVTCREGYQGTPATLQCGSTGRLHGSLPRCMRTSCDAAQLGSSPKLHHFAHNCKDLRHGEVCILQCARGYVGTSQRMVCNGTTLLGSLPSCVSMACTKGKPWGSGINASVCDNTTTGESCFPSCREGFQARPNAAASICGVDGAFGASGQVCEREMCMNLSLITGFQSNTVKHTCYGKAFGQTCSVFCAPGYDLVGPPVNLRCTTLSRALGAGGFVDAAGELASSPPLCTSRKCRLGQLQRADIVHDCTGKATGETCRVRAAAGFVSTQSSTHLAHVEMVCRADGLFHGPLLKLAPARCQEPIFPIGVGHSCSNKTYGSRCWAYCQAGYAGNCSNHKQLLCAA